MAGTDEQILHALDLTVVQDWEAAKRLLEPLDDPFAGRLFLLVCELEQREERRKRSLSLLRHEIGNALSIAQANIEGIMDGVLEQTPERLMGIHDALATCGNLLGEMERTPESVATRATEIGTFDICSLVGAQYATIVGLARAKKVNVVYEPCGKNHETGTHFRGDPSRIVQIVRNIMINAVRYTPPGGTIAIGCDRPDGALTIAVSEMEPGIAAPAGSGIRLSVVQNLLRAFGGNARVESEEPAGTTFVIGLPATPVAAN